VTHHTVAIQTVDNALYETSERFRVKLSHPEGAELGATDFTSITILDNDSK